MGLKPVLTEAGVGNEGNSHVEGVLHLFEDDTLHLFLLFWIDAEVEFVVYLKNHFRADIFTLETLEDVDHSDLDDIGSSALNRGNHGVGSPGITGSVLLIIFWSLISLCFITCLIRISFNLKKDQQNRPHDPFNSFMILFR